MSGVKPDEMIGTVLTDDGAHVVVLAAGDGAVVLRVNGTRYVMKRPKSEELGRILRAAAVHEPHRGVRSGRR